MPLYGHRFHPYSWKNSLTLRMSFLNGNENSYLSWVLWRQLFWSGMKILMTTSVGILNIFDNHHLTWVDLQWRCLLGLVDWIRLINLFVWSQSLAAHLLVSVFSSGIFKNLISNRVCGTWQQNDGELSHNHGLHWGVRAQLGGPGK